VQPLEPSDSETDPLAGGLIARAFEIGERITIGSGSGIVGSIDPSLGERELRLVVQLRRDQFSTT
jgi:hypothetical protein